MTVDEQTELGKQARRTYLKRIQQIMQDLPRIEAEYWEAVNSGDERRIKDAVRLEEAFWKSIGSARWHFHEEVRCLKPPA